MIKLTNQRTNQPTE